MLHHINNRFEEWLGAALLAVMVVVAFVNVVVRYCTNFSFSASEELTVNLFVWVVLLGTSRAFREGSNFSMNLIFAACPKAVQKVLYVMSLAACIAFFAWLAWLGAVEVYDEFELNVSSESLDIPVWLYTMATPLISALVIVRILQRALHDFKRNVF